MKRAIVVLTILVLLVTSVSCMPTKTGPTQKDLDQDATISTKVSKETFDALKETVNTVKTEAATVKTDVDALKTKVNQPSAATDVYTKTQVDAAIAQAVTNAVNNLKNDQSWIKVKTTTTSSSSSSSSDDDVIASSGELELIELTHLGDEVYFNNGGAQTWKLVVRNNDSTRHYFKLTLDMSLEDGSTVTLTAPPTISTSYPSSGQFRTSTTSFTGISEVSYTLYNDANPTSTYKVYIGKDTEQTVYVTVNLSYGGGVAGKLWTCEFGIKSYND